MKRYSNRSPKPKANGMKKRKTSVALRPRDAGQGGQSHTVPKSAMNNSNSEVILMHDLSIFENPNETEPEQLQIEWLLRTLRMIC